MFLTGFGALQDSRRSSAEDGESRANNFRLFHMNQWSRDAGSENSFPPPPPEDVSRGSRRLSNSSASQLAHFNLIQQGAAIDQGIRRLTAHEGVPEEVPIGHHGMQRTVRQGFLRSVPEGQVSGGDSPPKRADTLLHGRMQLPTPRGFEDSDVGSAPPPAPSWAPTATFSKWRDTLNYYSAPLRPPENYDSRESRSSFNDRGSFYDKMMPWRQSRQHGHSEETTSFREESLNERTWHEEQRHSQRQFQEEFMEFQEEDLRARPWAQAEPRQSWQQPPSFVDVNLNVRSREHEDQRRSWQPGPFMEEDPVSGSQLYEEDWQFQQRASAKGPVPFWEESPSSGSHEPRRSWQSRDHPYEEHLQFQQRACAEAPMSFREQSHSARSHESSKRSWQSRPFAQEILGSGGQTYDDHWQSQQRASAKEPVPFREQFSSSRSHESSRPSWQSRQFVQEVPGSGRQTYEDHWQSQQRASAEEPVPYWESQDAKRSWQGRPIMENVSGSGNQAYAEESMPFREQTLSAARHSAQHIPAGEDMTSSEEHYADAHDADVQSWRRPPRSPQDCLPSIRESQSDPRRQSLPAAPEHLPPPPEHTQDRQDESQLHLMVQDVEARIVTLNSNPSYDFGLRGRTSSSPDSHSLAACRARAPSALKPALQSSAQGGPSPDAGSSQKRYVSFLIEEDSCLGIGEEPEPEIVEEISPPGPNALSKRSWRPWRGSMQSLRSESQQEDPGIRAYRMQQEEAKRFSKKPAKISTLRRGFSFKRSHRSNMKSSQVSINPAPSVEHALRKQKTFTNKLDPEWRVMIRNATSFEADQLPEVSAGMMKFKASISGSFDKTAPSFGECLSSFCNGLHEVDAPLTIPSCALILSLFFAIGLCALLWSEEVPDLYEGAFGLITQTDRNATVDYTYFEKAREHAIASLSTVVGGQGDEDDPISGGTIIDYVNRSWDWRHVELIYTRTNGNVLAKVNDMRSLEWELRNLPGWVTLCDKVPQEVRHFCNPGDSFASVLFGTNQQPDEATAAMGNLNQVVFDGESGTMIMPEMQFIQFLKDFEEIHLKRWFADTGPKLADSPVRTTFAFYLPSDDFDTWDVFVKDELEPLLYEYSQKGDADLGQSFEGGLGSEDGPRLRLFYRATGLDPDLEFTRAAAKDVPLRAVPALGVFFAIMLTSRRLLLALAACILSVTTPLTSSTLLADRADTGKLEYPATTVAAWCIVSVSCCELALATANAWTMEEAAPMLPFCLKKVLPGWNVIYRVVRFLLEVPAPTLVPAFVLSICSSVVDLPLVTEFMRHTSLGLLSAILFSIMIFPPACEIGNKIAECAKRSDFMKHLREGRFGVLLPYECGGEPKFLDRLDALAAHCVGALSSKTVRTFAFFVTLAVVIGAGIKETSPQFIPDTPELWEEAHRLRVAPKVRELFGSGELMAGNGIPDQTFRSARKCTPDCYDSLECSWYKCEVDSQKEIDEGKCSCFSQTEGPAYAIRGCGAVARFVSLPPGSDGHAFAKVSFWRWAEEKLGVLLVNTSLSFYVMNVLEMESWATGLVTTEPQVVVKTHGSDGQAPLWEDACMRVLCYCGVSQCKLDSSWSFFGDIEINTPPERRLQIAQSESQAPLTNVFRRESNEIEINMVFGLRKTSFIPRKYVQPHMEFDNFEIDNPWVQRHVHRYCAGIPPRFNINKHRCWIEDYKRWLVGNGERFPTMNFYDKFHAFLAHAAYLKSLQLGVDYDYFWLNATGKVRGCYAVFNGHWDENVGIEFYMLRWTMYMYRRRKIFPAVASLSGLGTPWIASPQFNDYAASSAVKEAASNTVALSFSFLTLITLTLTCSPGLTVAIVLIEAVTLGILVGIGVGLGRRDFGAMEVCGLAIFMSGLITPLIRVAHQYTLARDGPGEAPSEKAAKAAKRNFPGKFRPRSASVTGEVLGIHKLDHNESFTSLPDPTPPTKDALSKKRDQVEEYLVDNSLLKARTIGIAYRLTPDLDDVDHKSRGLKGIAQWGTTVAGVVYKKDWVKVGERFLPLELKGVRVLEWQESDIPEKLFPSESSDNLGTCLQDLKASVVGPYDTVKIWRGAPAEERRKRSLIAVKKGSQIVIGASIAGFIAGLSLVYMSMEALGRIGLAALCAAVTAPSAALGFLPMLAMLPLLGPSRVRRRAFVEFAEWLCKPRGAHSPSTVEDGEPPDSSSAQDQSPIGKVAAEVLGLPFSLTVKSLAAHDLEPDLQWMLAYLPASLHWMVPGGKGSDDGFAAEQDAEEQAGEEQNCEDHEEQDGAAEVQVLAGTPAGPFCGECGTVFGGNEIACRRCGGRRSQVLSPLSSPQQ